MCAFVHNSLPHLHRVNTHNNISHGGAFRQLCQTPLCGPKPFAQHSDMVSLAPVSTQNISLRRLFYM